MRSSFDTKSRSWIDLESRGWRDDLRALARRSSRLLAAATASALLLVSILAPMLAPGRAAGSSQAEERADGYDEAQKRFGEELSRYRASQSDVSPDALESCARELCERFERCEGTGVVQFYRALAPEDRHEGWLAYQRYCRIRAQVAAAGTDPDDARAWKEERIRVLEELRELAEHCRTRPDYVPAAQSLALVALIEARQIERDESLNSDARNELATSAQAAALEAISLYQRAAQVGPQLEPVWVLGFLSLLRGDVAGAREQFDECLRIAERVRNVEYRRKALDGLLTTARWVGDPTEENRLLAELARVQPPQANRELKLGWASRLIAEDHAREALQFLDQMPPAEDAHVDDVFLWNLLSGGARMHIGELARAREHFEKLRSFSDSELSAFALASLEIREGRTERAISLLREVENRSNLSRPSRERMHALLGEALFVSGEYELAAEHLESAVEIALATGPELSRTDLTEKATGSVIGERLGLHTVALLAQSLAATGRIVEAVAAIETTQARSLRPVRSRIDAESVLRWARNSELGLLTWVVSDQFTFVALVGPDGRVASGRIAHGRVAIENAVRRLREATLARSASRLETLAKEITSVLIPEPIAMEMRRLAPGAGEMPRILVLAHGPTEALPFELLPWNAVTGRDDLVVLTLPGLPACDPGPFDPSVGHGKWRLLGSPPQFAGDGELRGAREELDHLAQLRPDSTAWVGSDFTSRSLAEALVSGDPIHVATHLVDDGQGRAALVTGDRRIFDESEVRKNVPKLPMAVLSACDSGGGTFVDAEGQIGLARAFLDSGTRNVVVTQWPVEDRAATLFGIAFHGALLEGASPSRAAARARRELAATGAPPADWAAFRLMGRD